LLIETSQMANVEDTQPGSQDNESDLAKDVAHLYSWARVEDVPYHDFSRQRRTAHAPSPPQAPERANGGASGSTSSIETQAMAFDIPVEEPVASEPPPALAPAAAAHTNIDAPVLPNPFIVPAAPDSFAPGKSRPLKGNSPVLAVYSLAGGVGKTTLCANLGRIFCAMKEKVLLVDASGSGLLPFYFGATDLRPGLRTFVAPDACYPPLQVFGADEVTKESLDNEVIPVMHRSQRTIFDLGPAAMGLLPVIFSWCDVVLVPLLSDLNSILTVSRIEASFKAMQSTGVKAPEVFYVFNQFDQNDAVDQQARALVERQCGDRLLPLAIRDGDEIPDAIAARMTVADHAPESAVTQDYLRLARWLRELMPPPEERKSPLRWSER
jgi:cellulose biosynthesis protein BcsQ